jgi:lysophospholipase L1-like esterase
MKNEHKIYAFFSAMAGFATNYFFVAALYQKSGLLKAYEPLSAAVWANTIAWGLVAFLFHKKLIRSERIKKVLFLFSFLQIFFVLTVCLDRFVGILNSSEASAAAPGSHDLIFPSNTTVRYKTTEFDCEMKINGLGLRNEEIKIEHGDKTRILCFGDSWTFGWGVDLEQSWPKVMNQYLVQNQLSVEVINCGQGGQYTTTYKKYMERLVPMLKPDLVVVGVLQGDDLAQLYENHYPLTVRSAAVARKPSLGLFTFIPSFFEKSYTNILRLSNRALAKPEYSSREEMKKQANTIMSGFTRLQAVRYETFDAQIKTMFENGDLNPALVNYYMFFPERMVIFNNPRHPAAQYAIEAMKTDIEAMKQICEKHQCRLVFVNLPTNIFTGHIVIRNSNTDGLFDEYLYTHNQIDSIYRNIAESLDIPYLEMTGLFKGLEPKDKYFYLYDGHPTADGYRVMGQTTGQYLMANQLLPEQRK